MSRVSPLRARSERTRQVAFVLSGGASLGAVQVGMLRALLERGIRPDLLIGTSVGAINSAWIAGRPDKEGVERLADIWAGLRRRDIFPFHPLTSAAGLFGRSNHFISSANLRSLLENQLPFRRLEETYVPLHVIATELKTGRATILTSGPAVPALLASCAIPGVYPPVTIGRRDYIDGGVANHTPITVALELGATDIYVLPVGYPWLNKEPTNALGIALQALARIIDQKLDTEVEANRRRAAIHVLPAMDVPDISPADFSHTQELIDWGYTSGCRYLSQANGRGVLPERARKTLQLKPSPAEAA
ncbi:MAG TPA: patatin-like phospholipase family protein [Candidatus Limnocylindrales bacterium]|nr:patatin-like phospholipase family protein [Candidatus Limnocylindrales bacterium]